MLWECSECGATTTRRSRVCAECGTVTRYTPADDASDGAGYEIGNLREYWVSSGARQDSLFGPLH